MSLLKSLAGDTAIYGISNILTRILNYLILTPYLSRVFSGEDTGQFGIHTLMYSMSAILLVIFTFRMETAFFRFGSQEKYKATAFSTGAIPLLAFTGIMIFVVYLFAPQIAGFLTRAEDARYVQYFAFIVGLDTIAALPFAKLRLENKAWWFVTVKIINIVLTIIIIMLWLELCPRLIDSGYAWFGNIYQKEFILDYLFLANLFASLAVVLLLLPQYLRMPWKFEKSLWKSMMIYSAPLVLVGIAGVINQFSDRYFMLRFLPGNYEENIDMVGVYSGCIKIAILMSLFTTAFNYAAEPFFFKHADRKDAKELYATVARSFILVASFAFLSICLYLDIIKYILDPSYWSALGIVPLILVAYLFLGLYYNISVWYKVTNKTNYGAIIAVAVAVFTILMNILLIPQFGIMGAAYTTVGAYLLMVVLGTIIGRKHYKVPYNWAAMAKYLGLAIVVLLFSNLLHQQFEMHLALKMLVNTALLIMYLGIIYFTDKKFLRALTQPD